MDTQQITVELDQLLEAFPRPEDRLDATPKIKSTEDAERAFLEIAWSNAVEAAIRAKIDDLLKQINDLVRAVGSDGGVTLRERRDALEAELLGWADRNRSTLCKGKKKSVELRNGRLRWRDAKDSVDYLDGCSQKTAIEAVGNESGLLAQIEELVDAIGWHGVFVAKLSVNKTAAVNARKKKQITDDQLAEVGLEFVPGDEYISVEAAEFVRPGA